MSVVLRNWARRPSLLSGYPPSPRRGPLVTPEMCPHFLLMSVASPQHQKGPLPPLQIRPIPRIFFSAQNRQFLHIGGPEDVIRLSLAYLGLLSWSVRSLAPSPASRKGIRRRRDGEADDDQRILLHQFNQLEGF